MKLKDVVILNEVADDFNDGRSFYDQKERGVGEYFWDSLIADIESLFIMQGYTAKSLAFIECLPSDSPMPFITKSMMRLLTSSQCYLCVVIPHGLRTN